MPGEPPGSSDPLDPAGLVGRTAEAAAIRRMLDGASLVTVTGLPGVGKTAVSLAAARAAAAGLGLRGLAFLAARREHIHPVRLSRIFIRQPIRRS